MQEQQTQKYSISEYLVFEENAIEKHEYDNGVITAMSGGTLNHGIIGNNINAALNNALAKNKLDCTAINGDVRVWIEQANSFVYPDAMVICGKIETAKEDKNAVINPILIIEVLSKSTESYDRGDKFHKYASLPTFKEYVLIDQQKPVIDVLCREADNHWKMSTKFGLEDELFFALVNTSIPLSAVYKNVQDLGKVPFS